MTRNYKRWQKKFKDMLLDLLVIWWADTRASDLERKNPEEFKTRMDLFEKWNIFRT